MRVLSAPDGLSSCRVEEIEQGYLLRGVLAEAGQLASLAIEADEVEVRIRRRGEGAYLTAKRGSGRQRNEVEVELGPEEFEALWPLTAGRRLSKARHYVPTEAGEIEVDVYRGALEGLIVAEIEFGPEDQPESFEAPKWLDDELTGKPGYANKSLATRGIPTDASIADAAPGAHRDRALARRALVAMVGRGEADRKADAAAKPPVRASPRAAAVRLTSALEELEEQPDPTRRDRLRRCCLEYGAAAIAAAAAFLGSGRLIAQVHPTKDSILQLVVEQDPDRDWMGSRAPIAAWREAFSANQSEIGDGTGPPAGLFDRVIAAAGLAADLCGWLEDPAAGAVEASSAANAPSAQRGR